MSYYLLLLYYYEREKGAYEAMTTTEAFPDFWTWAFGLASEDRP